MIGVAVFLAAATTTGITTFLRPLYRTNCVCWQSPTACSGLELCSLPACMPVYMTVGHRPMLLLLLLTGSLPTGPCAAALLLYS